MWLEWFKFILLQFHHFIKYFKKTKKKKTFINYASNVSSNVFLLIFIFIIGKIPQKQNFFFIR